MCLRSASVISVDRLFSQAEINVLVGPASLTWPAVFQVTFPIEQTLHGGQNTKWRFYRTSAASHEGG
jgi:hypothetical protein